MGATYTVRWIASAGTPSEYDLRKEIDAELAQLDEKFSRYRSDSELARINAARADEPLAVSSEFAQLLRESIALNEYSAGAFDVTVAPLVDAWGFGPQQPEARAPQPLEIQQLLQRCGVDMVEMTSASTIRKHRADVELDFNAIAPGYAADRISGLLQRHGMQDYLIDIGGEIRVSGHNARGSPWRIAIDDPRHIEQVPYAAVELTGGAVATSGGYRHFRVIDGKRYSHLMDPRSGYPASLATAAVIVIAPTAAEADGWATALFVLGEKEGLMVASQRRIAALFLLFDGTGLREHASEAFLPYRVHAM